MISIAMTTYNGEKYLREQIDSILSQTIQDFELIVGDDCSTDSTWDIIEDYAKRDNRFHIYKNTVNIGFLKNFEKAIELCQGDYIALSDQDDIWTENHLEVLLNTIGDKVLACGNSLLVDENGNSMGMTLKEQESLDYVPRNDFKKLISILLFRNPYQGSSMLFRRDLIRYINPMPVNVQFHDTWIASLACLLGGMNYSDTIILKYRRHDMNITKSKKRRKSKWWFFRKRYFARNRSYLISELFSRVTSISSSERKQMAYIKMMLDRSTNIAGSRKNLGYLIKNYRTIYSCDLKHWL